MRISVLGLGYVGCVSVACMAADGHQVTGVDINPLKVNMINEGHSPIVERGLDKLMAEGVASGRLCATLDATEAVQQSDLSFVCVGTPGDSNGRLDLQYVVRVSEEIGRALKSKPDYHVVVLRSTMLPGSTEEVVLPTLERMSDRRVGDGFGLAYNPEFLREGTAVQDFYDPPRTVIGQWDERSGGSVAAIYAALDAPLIRTSIKTAEMVKYADNAFHALKIAFANEIGVLCGNEGIDSHELMRIFVQDTKLNLSPVYLRPGYAFGGSCLPKDLRALNHHARMQDVATPVLSSILDSNELHKRRGLSLVQETGKKRVAVLGLSFKPDTDDLRESPAVELVEGLLGKGYHLKIYDRNVALAKLVGANKEFIEREIPHIASLMVPDLRTALADAEVVVVTSGDGEFRTVPDLLRPDQVLVDLERIVDNPDGLGDRYYGIAW
jgi:GDP-mannose 6-dehydrogenase